MVLGSDPTRASLRAHPSNLRPQALGGPRAILCRAGKNFINRLSRGRLALPVHLQAGELSVAHPSRRARDFGRPVPGGGRRSRAKPGGAAARVRAPEAPVEHVTTPRGAGRAVPRGGGGGESNGGRGRLRGGCAASTAAEVAGAAGRLPACSRPPPARDLRSPSSPSASHGAGPRLR